jgi:hypothetical protein
MDDPVQTAASKESLKKRKAEAQHSETTSRWGMSWREGYASEQFSPQIVPSEGFRNRVLLNSTRCGYQTATALN